MNPLIECLTQSPLFCELPEDQKEQLLAISIEKHLRKSEAVFFEGDDCDGLYLVIEGKIKVYKLSPDGKEKILHIFSVGEPVGEVAMFSGREFPANAETLTSCRLLFFPRKSFVQLITDNPSLALNMMAILSSRLKQFATQIEGLSLKDVPARLATYLLYLMAEEGDGTRICLNITKGQLASILGTIPETLSRMMAKMSNMGMIRVQGRTIDIEDAASLENLAESGRFSDE